MGWQRCRLYSVGITKINVSVQDDNAIYPTVLMCGLQIHLSGSLFPWPDIKAAMLATVSPIENLLSERPASNERGHAELKNFTFLAAPSFFLFFFLESGSIIENQQID